MKLKVDGRSRFTDGKPRIATAEECKAAWCGVKNGANFRCAFCGHRFRPGDYWRWQYTNDIAVASGNPIVCEDCDEGPELTREKWKRKHAEFASGKWWWFDGSGSVYFGVCLHPKNIGPGVDWRGEDDTSYIENPWDKNIGRRCRDFEAKEGK